VHLTETCGQPAGDPAAGQPAVPNLITNVATTPASTADVAMTGPIHDGLEAAGLAPGEHAVDTGYTSADELAAAPHRAITPPPPPGVPRRPPPRAAPPPPQPRPGGPPATPSPTGGPPPPPPAPQAPPSLSGGAHPRHGGQQFIVARFSQPACHPCPARANCTT